MGASAPSNMEIVFFKTTLIGDWSVRLSCNDADEYYLLHAYNTKTFEFLVRPFPTANEVVQFVNFLGAHND